jgi:hypothetical protein
MFSRNGITIAIKNFDLVFLYKKVHTYMFCATYIQKEHVSMLIYTLTVEEMFERCRYVVFTSSGLQWVSAPFHDNLLEMCL